MASSRKSIGRAAHYLETGCRYYRVSDLLASRQHIIIVRTLTRVYLLQTPS